MSGEQTLPTVFLHIGTPKSGTTYLQSRMEANRARAAEQGLLWPGPRWGVHVEAARDLRQLGPGDRLAEDGAWMRLVRAVHDWSGPGALISMEWLAGCTPAQATAAVESLQPARVEIVVTTRDLLRMFVAQWQEMTKNCRPWSWRQFVDEMVEEGSGPAAHRFWTQQDVPLILRRWQGSLSWEQFRLVTVPPQGADPEVLWDRFCSVLGIDGTAFEQPAKNNESIGVVSASLMHRVNLVAIREGMSKVEYQRVLHRRLADDVLAPFRSREASFAVSPATDAWIRARAERLVADIGQYPVTVVGDLTDLRPGAPLEGREPSDVTDAELLDTAVEALVTLARTQDSLTRQLRAQQQTLRQRLTRAAGSGRRVGKATGRPGATGKGLGRTGAAKKGVAKKGAATNGAAKKGAAKKGAARPAAEGVGLARQATRLARRSKAKLSRVLRSHPDEPGR